MICAKVENGVVVNSAMWGECPTGWIESNAPIGYLYSNGEFTAPEQEPPTVEELQASAKETRDNAISSYELNYRDVIEFDSVEFDVSIPSISNMEKTIKKGDASGYPDSDSRLWRLADNSWRETTLGEMRQIVVLAQDKYDADTLAFWEMVWLQFGAWDAGPKDSPFVVEL